jgi:hypothetical protein
MLIYHLYGDTLFRSMLSSKRVVMGSLFLVFTRVCIYELVVDFLEKRLSYVHIRFLIEFPWVR